MFISKGSETASTMATRFVVDTRVNRERLMATLDVADALRSRGKAFETCFLFCCGHYAMVTPSRHNDAKVKHDSSGTERRIATLLPLVYKELRQH